MDALGFLIAIAIASVVFYLYLRHMFSKDSLEDLSKGEIKPAAEEVNKGKSMSKKKMGNITLHKIEPGIDSSYQEIIMGPSSKNIYVSEDYFEGSSADEPR